MQETQEMWVWSLDWEDPLKKEMATHSSTLAWKTPWTEDPGELQSKDLQRVGHDWATNFHRQITMGPGGTSYSKADRKKPRKDSEQDGEKHLPLRDSQKVIAVLCPLDICILFHSTQTTLLTLPTSQQMERAGLCSRPSSGEGCHLLGGSMIKAVPWWGLGHSLHRILSACSSKCL